MGTDKYLEAKAKFGELLRGNADRAIGMIIGYRAAGEIAGEEKDSLNHIARYHAAMDYVRDIPGGEERLERELRTFLGIEDKNPSVE